MRGPLSPRPLSCSRLISSVVIEGEFPWHRCASLRRCATGTLVGCSTHPTGVGTTSTTTPSELRKQLLVIFPSGRFRSIGPCCLCYRLSVGYFVLSAPPNATIHSRTNKRLSATTRSFQAILILATTWLPDIPRKILRRICRNCKPSPTGENADGQPFRPSSVVCCLQQVHTHYPDDTSIKQLSTRTNHINEPRF